MDILTDVHTHTAFSPDGQDDIDTMLARAKELRLAWWGIAEHFDYDYLTDNIPFVDGAAQFTDPEAYFPAARALQQSEKEVHILAGAELGFTRNRAVVPLYRNLIARYRPDFIVNSVHTQGTQDYYYRTPFRGKDQKKAYGDYLALVRESLDADYPYDIVGHIGYPARYAPYADKSMDGADFIGALVDILTTIIVRGKILEVNTSAAGADAQFLPFPPIVRRYFALGGREISIASDAHGARRLADKRQETAAILKEIGFAFVTVPCRGEKIRVEL